LLSAYYGNHPRVKKHLALSKIAPSVYIKYPTGVFEIYPPCLENIIHDYILATFSCMSIITTEFALRFSNG